MESTGRYEIVDTIASGDFATVYRARDRELAREVAIKQIHQQFLSDPKQLERYWREAQLLASLQHPNIMTIYDIVRPKGWLILELMRGNLQRSTETSPIDLDLLRVVLLCSLNALHFLHTNGVIHGDVKPSNMLVDPQGRIKLGDFGLARRASNEQGSLLKGTTKYMAPELVSNQFGPIGPASDLYSLGFSAYELMCGPHFEALFPGLNTFGRDRQIAWLMWHAAPDRNLPEIARVLEGVPEDLARVVERLVAKDQSVRYQTAQDALQDLRTGRVVAAPAIQPAEPAAPPPDKKRKLVRMGAIAALALSSLLSIYVLFSDNPPEPPPKQSQAVEGVVRSVDLDRRKLILELPGGEPKELDLTPDDRFYVNDKKSLFRELQPADRIAIKYVMEESGRKIREVYASRPQTSEGRIKAVEADAGRFTLAYGSGDDQLVLRVPGTAKLLFNGSDKIEGQPVKLGDLRVGDRVQVQHVAEESGRAVVQLTAQRQTDLQGVVRGVDVAKKELTVEQGEGKDAKTLVLPVSPDCRVTLNERNKLDERLLSFADLKPGDRAKITHDTQVVSVDAIRILGQAGTVQAVQPNALDVQLEGQDKPRTFLVDAQCRITLAGERAELSDLRTGDAIDITHDSPSPNSPSARALTIAARRPADQTRWAILIGNQNYDDASLGALPFAAADAKLIHDTLVARYSVPASQALLLTDASLVRMKQGIASLLERIQAPDRLIVYYVGHALRDGDGKVYLATKEFNREQMAATGLSFQWLVDQLEACQSKDKILLLDACHAAEDADSAKEPSSAEMFQSLQGPGGRALRTLTGIASCSEGQRGYDLPQQKRGLFAAALAEGMSGQADKNRDNRLESTELYSFLIEAMTKSAASIQKSQTAKLFLPDTKPPRLSDDAKKAIRDLAGLVLQNDAKVADAKLRYTAAQNLAEKEIEPKLLYGLVLMKLRQREAERQFADLRIEKPELLLPIQAMAWLRFDKRDYADGIRGLTEMAVKLKPGQGAASPALQQVVPWMGQLREFAAAADERNAVSQEAYQQLDAAVASIGLKSAQLYEQGREQTRGALADYDARIKSADNEAVRVKLRLDRGKVGNFATFPYEAMVQNTLSGLDQ